VARLTVIDCDDDENDGIPLGLLPVCLSAVRRSAIRLLAICLSAVCQSAVCPSPFCQSDRLADPIVCASFPVSPSLVDSLDSEFWYRLEVELLPWLQQHRLAVG
jgi:hypothetical protein